MTSLHTDGAAVLAMWRNGGMAGKRAKQTAKTRRPSRARTTRAAVLEALFDRPETTSGLARRLNISVASASEHAAVLRATKLVTSVRDGNRVVHQVSSFGYAFLRSTVEPGRMKSQ